MLKKIITTAAAAFTVSLLTGAGGTQPALTGKLMYHSYSSYEARDSRLYVYDCKEKTSRCINDEITGVYDLMNGNFGCSPDDIVFMGLTGTGNNADWNIYRYNLRFHTLADLVPDSGLREEDVKFSPDGCTVVYKQGRWDHIGSTMRYNIAALDLITGESRLITDDDDEESMPYFTSDGQSVLYTKGTGADSGIYMKNIYPGDEKCLYDPDDICAYYPVVHNDRICFTAWNRSDNHNDGIFRYISEYLPAQAVITDPGFNCSDACFVDDTDIIISSSQNGHYDLFAVNTDNDAKTELCDVNSQLNELGADYFDCDKYYETAEGMKNWLLGVSGQMPEGGDVDMDGKITVRDYCLLGGQ
ncbi:MAG: hypothetical protein Q4F95_06060 [Oscillospiraceae bacterium]|nr:hypothetical protein [Oscillospiraceae bacterium]